MLLFTNCSVICLSLQQIETILAQVGQVLKMEIEEGKFMRWVVDGQNSKRSGMLFHYGSR